MSLIVCKKCSGPHLTIKCGKEPKPKEIEVKKEPKVYLDKRKCVTVRMSNLPSDISLDEMEDLMNEWGYIARVNLNNYENKPSTSFVDFYHKKEAEYFIEAVNRTPFDNMILHVDLIENRCF